jgi:toxin ParE1/3/4
LEESCPVSKRAQVIYTAKAEDDLFGIYLYSVSQWDQATADNYIAGLRRTCQTLARYGKLGRRYGGRHRRVVYERHVVFYRLQKSGNVVIDRVLHGRQLPSKAL